MTVERRGADLRRVDEPSSGGQVPGSSAEGSLASISKEFNVSPSSSLVDCRRMTERLGCVGEMGDTVDSIRLKSAARGESGLVAG
jgi:hypothetical protein